MTDACKEYGGFYLGSVGGAAAVGQILFIDRQGFVRAQVLAEDCIKKVEAIPVHLFGFVKPARDFAWTVPHKSKNDPHSDSVLPREVLEFPELGMEAVWKIDACNLHTQQHFALKHTQFWPSGGEFPRVHPG